MATLHTNGTQLEQKAIQAPLNGRFIFFIGLTYLLGMHFFMRNPGGSGLELSFNPTTWAVIIGAYGVGLYQIARSGLLRYSKLTLIYLIGCILLTIPALYTINSGYHATPRLIGLWSGWLLFLLLQQFRFSNLHKQRLLWFVVIAVAIQAVYGLTQYLILEPGNPFGYNTEANRPYGIFQQPNVMASFLATGLVLSGYLLARQPQKKYDSRVRKVLFLYLIPVLTVPLLVVLASRTGWIAAVLSVALIIPYLVQFSTRKRVTYWLSSVAIGLVAGLVLFNQGGESEFISNKVSLSSARETTFPQTLDMIVEKPLTGYGYGQFESQYMLYTARQHQLNSDYPPGLPSLDHPHNELMLWTVEGGLLPLIALLIITLITIQRIASARTGTRLALFALLLPIALHAQLEYPFDHSAIHWISFVILLFWVDQKTAKYQSQTISPLSRSILKIGSLVIPSVVVLFMATTLHTNYVLQQFETARQPDPTVFDRISNPVVWQDRIDWDIHSHLLNIGLHQRDPNLIQQYVNWSLVIIERAPRPAFYSNLVMAYKGLGETAIADRITEEAKFLFPNYDIEAATRGRVLSRGEMNTSAAKFNE